MARSVAKQTTPHSDVVGLQGFDLHLFVQLNDVYFIDARPDYSKADGLLLPRIGTMVQRLSDYLPGKVTVCIPGDFLAPSCLGKLTRGSHMVDIFNTIGVNFVSFGNHEFEQPPLSPATLAGNIAGSNFTWLCANFVPTADELKPIFAADNKVRRYELMHLADGLVVALLGVTLKETYSAYGEALEPNHAVRSVIEDIRHKEPTIKDGTDEPIFIVMTHQDAKDDREFAINHPDVILVMGGHDHDEDYVIDQFFPMVVKAASNARTIRFNVLLYRRADAHSAQPPPNLEQLWLDSRSIILNRVFATLTHEAVMAAPASVRELMEGPTGPEGPTDSAEEAFIDDTRLRSGIKKFGGFEVGLFSFAIDTTARAVREHIPEKAATAARIKHWENYWDQQSGSTRVPVLTLQKPFNARDGQLRRKSTNMGNFAADALLTAPSGTLVAQIGLLNSGTLRIDRDLRAGEKISQRTICDLLFFDNTVHVFELSGREIWQLLTRSFQLRSAGGAEGHGDFLQISGVKVLWAGNVIDRVLRTDHTTFEEDLPADDALHRVSTTDYVAQKSKHYKDIFRNKSGEEIGHYTKMFNAALRRLGSLTKLKSAKGYYKITNDRWLPCDKHRNLFSKPQLTRI